MLRTWHKKNILKKDFWIKKQLKLTKSKLWMFVMNNLDNEFLFLK